MPLTLDNADICKCYITTQSTMDTKSKGKQTLLGEWLRYLIHGNGEHPNPKIV